MNSNTLNIIILTTSGIALLLSIVAIILSQQHKENYPNNYDKEEILDIFRPRKKHNVNSF